MRITVSNREFVRQRANFACEFCTVTETDSGGELTIDHFQPRAKGGDNHLDNLLYCCIRCNQYKRDYWAVGSEDVRLWNPRVEPASQHFLNLDDGTLHPLTTVGKFTLSRLRLNRPQLIAYRLNKQRRTEKIHTLARYNDLAHLLEQLHRQMADLVEDQQELLYEQHRLIKLLLNR